MKRAFAIVMVLGLLFVITASTAFASGDKVRGEDGQGDVNQVQVMDPPPFQP